MLKFSEKMCTQRHCQMQIVSRYELCRFLSTQQSFFPLSRVIPNRWCLNAPWSPLLYHLGHSPIVNNVAYVPLWLELTNNWHWGFNIQFKKTSVFLLIGLCSYFVQVHQPNMRFVDCIFERNFIYWLLKNSNSSLTQRNIEVIYLTMKSLWQAD